MIYATVGTMFLDFPRLIRKLDAIAETTGERIVIQTGLGATLPQRCDFFDFKSRDEVLALQQEARVIVCHAGIGSILDALSVRRPFVVVPRRLQFNEHLSDHQLEIAEAIQRRAWGRMVLDIDDLPEACADPPAVYASYRPAKHRLISAVRDAIERVAAAKNR
ncbi:MAG TPA: glycosyltransferase [Candidatus Hydrogenedentes bacterium]|nr:glycosyltransferase [Candidatus Hydrogenedentota bacterium]HOS04051.1 glycosyltransferase [Candidatus Hydrogenedentota bacterium]